MLYYEEELLLSHFYYRFSNMIKLLKIELYFTCKIATCIFALFMKRIFFGLLLLLLVLSEHNSFAATSLPAKHLNNIFSQILSFQKNFNKKSVNFSSLDFVEINDDDVNDSEDENCFSTVGNNNVSNFYTAFYQYKYLKVNTPTKYLFPHLTPVFILLRVLRI